MAAHVRGGRWLITLAAGAGSFGGVWGVSALFDVPVDVALGLAGAATALVMAPLSAWAARDRLPVSTMTVDSPLTQPSPAAEVSGRQPEVNLDELPTTLVGRIVGRERELDQLRQLLDDDGTSVVALVGFGGVGKSSLVDAFLTEIAPGYGGADRVFGWHFYSQEEQSSAAASSSMFWDHALRFFGFTEPIPTHETEKAHELLRLFRDQRVILVLDGIESLQNPPHVNQGLLSHKAVQAFLTSVARDGLSGGGLVIVTSRQPVVELGRFDLARPVELDMLDLDSGAALLRALGVRGSPAELRAAVLDYKGHPLSLVLLGKILATDYRGDILKRFNLEMDDTEVEDNIEAILDYYSRSFDERDPELVYMYMISLFRRPMRDAELEALTESSQIGQSLRTVPGPRVERAISRLRDRGLIIVDNDQYDTHALIRRYFAARFRARHGERFVQAHATLFRYFADLPGQETPADLDGLEPLYRAIYHGCQAGEYAPALDIYWHRISRQREFFSQKKLGAHSSDLVAVIPFFPDGWEAPVVDGLSGEQRAFLLGLASFLLTTLGRLTEAIKPRYTEIEMFEALHDSRQVCSDLRNLVQILLPLGRLDDALRASDRAISAAEQLDSSTATGSFSQDMDDTYLHVSALVRKATTLHRMNSLDQAAELFARAEELHGAILDRVNGFYYGSFLRDVAVDEVELREVVRRGEANLRTARDRGNLGDIGNCHVTLGGAHLRLGEFAPAEHNLNEAVRMLRRADRVDRVPYTLIERASLWRQRWLRSGSATDLRRCEADLYEADQVISFSRMALFQVDHDLLRAHLLADQGHREQARELVLTSVVPAISRTGYRLRQRNVDEIVARVGDADG